MSIAHVNAVLELQLPPAQKHVLTVLAHRLNNNSGTCNPSLDRLMRDTGLSRSGLQKQLRTLIKSKLITANRHKRRSTIYTLLLENFARFFEAHKESLREDKEPLGGPQGKPQRLTRKASEAHEESPEQELKEKRTTTTERRRDLKMPKTWTEQERRAVIPKLSELTETQAQDVIDVADLAKRQGQIRRGLVPLVIGLTKAAKVGTLDISQVQKTRAGKTGLTRQIGMSPHIAQQILMQMDLIESGQAVLIGGYGLAMTEDVEKARKALNVQK